MAARDDADLLALAEALPDVRLDGTTALVVHDRAGRLLLATEAAEDVLGADLATLRGRDVGDLSRQMLTADGAPLDPRSHPAAVVLDTGAPAADLVVGLPAQPTSPHAAALWRRWFALSAAPLYGSPDEGPVGAVSVLREIRDQHRDGLRLAEAERILALLQHSPDLLLTMTADTTITWASQASSRLLGVRAADLLGRRALELVDESDLQVAQAELQRVAAGGGHGQVEVRLRRADGSVVWADVVGHALTEDGVLHGWHAVFRDAHARITTGMERDEARRRLELVMRSSPVGLAVVAPDGHWLEVNDTLCALLGYDRPDLLNLTFLQLTHPDDRADTQAAFEDLVQGRQDMCASEKRYLRSDGQAVWAHRVATIARHADGSPAYFIAQLQDITERKQAQEQLAALAIRDPLTGLPNRLLLTDRLNQAVAAVRRDGAQVAVLYLDLDLFKHVNDDFGHDAGDEVLREVARRLGGVLRDSDTAVRVGGDEFVVLCPRVTSRSAITALADRIRSAVARPISVGEDEVQVTASIGISMGASPDAQTLLKQADTAMYRAKKRGRDRADVFDQAAQAAAVEMLVQDRQLRLALEQDQFVMHYQPIVDLVTGRVVAREALIRWAHPTAGLLLPKHFLGPAEETRLIVSIGTWALRRACLEASPWPDQATVNVNISSRHFADAQFADTITQVLHLSGLPARRLCIEITETSVLHASVSTLTSIRRLHALGVKVSLDDFGTGQSSIAALHRLPIDSIKIDRSFISDVTSDERAANLVGGLIGLGRGLGLDVVAEGVEDQAQARWLQERGCRLAQGWLYGRPAPGA